MRKILILFTLLTSVLWSQAQILEPVKWTVEHKEVAENEYDLIFKASIDEGFHLYSQDIPEGGPVATSFNFIDAGAKFELVGNTKEPEAHIQHDPNFMMDLKWFSHDTDFVQRVKVSDANLSEIKAEVTFMSCDDTQCLPPETLEFAFVLKEETAAVEETSVNAIEAPTSEESGDQRSYWGIFIISFLSGFAALLTPCVFPMIPMTVSFFTKQSKNKSEGIKKAIIYGLSIIVIYVALGTVVTKIFGADSLNAMATNVWFNLFFFLLLVIFGLSFLGAFEIVLPSSWVNAADKKADKGGYVGIFFMALVLALVSFSCTGPIVGTLIVEAASQGGTAPIVGMLGFSLAIALPFTLFAAFPGWLNSLPQSGGWLNSVKVTLGLLELALAMKFLSTADMVMQWHILEREVFIASWVVIFGILGFYLLGKIRFPHDSPIDTVSVPRAVLAIVVLTFTVYLIPGIWGAPVKAISAFAPPSFYAESPNGLGGGSSHGTLAASTHIDEDFAAYIHEGPQNIPAFKDYDVALKYAKKHNKPMLLDFTGWGCVNCRRMEAYVWADEGVHNMLSNDYVLVSLYVDEKKELPEDEKYVSEKTGKKIKTVGNKWSDFQITRFNKNSQPHYVILDSNGEVMGKDRAYDTDIDAYKTWLQEGLDNFGMQ